MIYSEALYFVKEGGETENPYRLIVSQLLIDKFGLEVSLAWTFFYSVLGHYPYKFDNLVQIYPIQEYEERIAFLEYHFSKHTGKELAFLSFLRHAVFDSLLLFSSWFLSPLNKPYTEINQKEVLDWVDNKYLILNILKNKKRKLTHFQWALFYYYLNNANEHSWFNDDSKSLLKRSEEFQSLHGLNSQRFRQTFTNISNEKSGYKFRRGCVKTIDLEVLQIELQGYPKALKLFLADLQ